MAACAEKGGISMMYNNFRLPISEELLGAYLEGNLSIEEAQMVEHIMRERGGFHNFVNELQSFDDMLSSNNYEEIPSYEMDFELPEITYQSHSEFLTPLNSIDSPSLNAEDMACSVCEMVSCAYDDIITQNEIEDNSNMVESTDMDIELSHTDDTLFENDFINE